MRLDPPHRLALVPAPPPPLDRSPGVGDRARARDAARVPRARPGRPRPGWPSWGSGSAAPTSRSRAGASRTIRPSTTWSRNRSRCSPRRPGPAPGLRRRAARARRAACCRPARRAPASRSPASIRRSEPGVSTIAAPASRVAGAYLRPRARLALHAPSRRTSTSASSSRARSSSSSAIAWCSPCRRAAARTRPRRRSWCAACSSTGIDELDGFYVEIPLSDAQQLLRARRGRDPGRGADPAPRRHRRGRCRARDRAGGSRRSRGRCRGSARCASSTRRSCSTTSGFYLMMAIVFVIVGIGIFNTVLMSVIERTRELGVMMAIGTSKRRLFAIVLAEAAILAARGLGRRRSRSALAIHAWIRSHGLDISSLFGDIQVAGIVVHRQGVLAALGRRRRAMDRGRARDRDRRRRCTPRRASTRLDPLEAMRHV